MNGFIWDISLDLVGYNEPTIAMFDNWKVYPTIIPLYPQYMYAH